MFTVLCILVSFRFRQRNIASRTLQLDKPFSSFRVRFIKNINVDKITNTFVCNYFVNVTNGYYISVYSWIVWDHVLSTKWCDTCGNNSCHQFWPDVYRKLLFWLPFSLFDISYDEDDITIHILMSVYDILNFLIVQKHMS